MLCTLPWAGWVGISPGKPGLRSYWGGIITKHAADSSDTKAALTSSLLVASRGWPRSLLTLLAQTTSHHSWEAETSCSITRHETDFFQLQWTGHKPRPTTSSAQTEQGEDGWAGTEDKRGVGAAQGTLNKVVIHFNLTFSGDAHKTQLQISWEINVSCSKGPPMCYLHCMQPALAHFYRCLSTFYIPDE